MTKKKVIVQPEAEVLPEPKRVAVKKKATPKKALAPDPHDDMGDYKHPEYPLTKEETIPEPVIIADKEPDRLLTLKDISTVMTVAAAKMKTEDIDTQEQGRKEIFDLNEKLKKQTAACFQSLLKR